MARASRLAAQKITADKRATTIGFGAPAGMPTPSVLSIFKDALNCSVYAMPTVAVSEWVFDGPLSHQDTQKTFGPTIDVLAGKPDGVSNFYSTPGFNDGEFQTHTLACGIGVHLETPPVGWTARGNAFLASQFAAAARAKPFSPDVWTIRDQGDPTSGAGGAWAAAGTPPQAPAFLRFGNWANLGFWYMVRAYNLRWTFGSLINIMDEPLRYTAFTPDTAQAGSAGEAQLDAYKWAREANDYYSGGVGDCCLKSSLVFELCDTIRIGAAADGSGRFMPNRDFEFVDYMSGGGQLGSALRGNSEFRTLDNAYVLKPGVQVGLIFEERNSDLANEFRAEFDASAGTPSTAGGSIPAVYTESSAFASGAGSVFTERTLDGGDITQTLPSQRAEFKIGPAIITQAIKGWEISESLACQIRDNPDLASQLCSECGTLVTWAN